MAWGITILIWCVCAGFAALIASSKHRSPGRFALAGLLLGPVGLLWAAFATSDVPRSVQRQRNQLERARAERDRLDRPAMMRSTRIHWPD